MLVDNSDKIADSLAAQFPAEAALTDAALLPLDAFASFAVPGHLMNRGLNICQG
jgi:hypothetical protein